MRALLTLLGLCAVALAEEAPREVPLLNVEIVDREAVTTRLSGFHRVSGESRFQGYLGSGEIEVPYARVREVRVLSPERPGGRMRAHLTLRSGDLVTATFDEREGEQLFSGFSEFGRVSVFFRDVRQLRILGRTTRDDLPDFGPAAEGVDAKITDREGVQTELVRFRRAGGESTIPGVLGAARIEIPLRIVRRLDVTPNPRSADLDATATVRGGGTLHFRIPVYDEETVYRGDAAFGRLRIHLGRIREIEVHRITPELRDLDPLAAARGRIAEDDPRR